MAEFLLGYAYEPEYTPEELKALSKAAATVCTEATSAGSVWGMCFCSAAGQRMLPSGGCPAAG